MVTNSSIGRVLTIIEKEAAKWKLPVVSVIANDKQSPFRVLISTLLSLRTKDQVTENASIRLFNVADNPHSMLKLSAEAIQKLIYPVAFYRNKSNDLLNICRKLIDEYHGQVPESIEELLKFKGVGRKTANLVLILGYNKPAMCVDTHVHRISNRFGYIKTKTPDESEMALRKKLPVQYWLKYNDLLVAFGQNHCKPVSPLCSTCKIKKLCARKGVTVSR